MINRRAPQTTNDGMYCTLGSSLPIRSLDAMALNDVSFFLCQFFKHRMRGFSENLCWFLLTQEIIFSKKKSLITLLTRWIASLLDFWMVRTHSLPNYVEILSMCDMWVKKICVRSECLYVCEIGEGEECVSERVCVCVWERAGWKFGGALLTKMHLEKKQLETCWDFFVFNLIKKFPICHYVKQKFLRLVSTTVHM